MKILTIFIVMILCVFLFLNAAFAEIEKIKTIEIFPGDADIGHLSSFAVTETGYIIFTDFKAADIKIFDSEGRWIKNFGRQGQGPNEFGQPFFSDYWAPYFGFMDIGRRKVFVYEITNSSDFVRIGEFLCTSIGSDIKIRNGNIIISGHQTDGKGKPFALYEQMLSGGPVRTILPSWIKYGLNSERDYYREYREKDDIVALGINGFFDEIDKEYYFIWEGRLLIFRINSDGKVVASFGQETGDFRKPVASSGLKQAYRSRSGRSLAEEKRKYSRIFGVFADENFVRLLYANYEAGREAWSIRLQSYSRNGKHLSDLLLLQLKSSESFLSRPYFYMRSQSILFLAFHESDLESGDIYRINVYKLQEP